MTFLKFTILTEGKLNGDPVWIHAEDIRKFAQIEVKSDSTYLIGQSTMRKGTILFLDAHRGMPTQSVQESVEEVAEALGGAVTVRKQYA